MRFGSLKPRLLNKNKGHRHVKSPISQFLFGSNSKPKPISLEPERAPVSNERERAISAAKSVTVKEHGDLIRPVPRPFAPSEPRPEGNVLIV